MNLIKKDLLRLNNAISAIEGRPFNRKFSYFLAQHKLKIKDEILMLNEIRQPTKEFKEYDLKRSNLAQEHADRNPDGTPKVINQEFVVTVQGEKFQEEIKKLKEEYKEVIEDCDQQLKEYNEILNEETKYSGAKIDLEDIPDNIEPVVIEVLLSAGLVNTKKVKK